MDIKFAKMHGLGNDFVVIDDTADAIDFAPEAIEWFCDRNYGIGGDGLILIRPATDDAADFFMAYYNADGQQAEMCGNGIRCLVKYVVDHGLAGDDDTVTVETLSGLKKVTVTRDENGLAEMMTVDMGVPSVKAPEVPTTVDEDIVVGCPMPTEAGTLMVTAVSMGNPHCVIVVDDVNEAPVDTIGPLVENDPRFPEKTNVEFAQLIDKNHIALRVWERGVGETLACGTGACATLVAFSLLCMTERSATVELPGGELNIVWAEDDHVYMTGPATEVFEGVVCVSEDDAEDDTGQTES